MVMLVMMALIGYFANVPVSSQVDFRTNLCRDFYAIRELGLSANVTVPKDASLVFSLALQDLILFMERDSAVAAKAVQWTA